MYIDFHSPKMVEPLKTIGIKQNDTTNLTLNSLNSNSSSRPVQGTQERSLCGYILAIFLYQLFKAGVYIKTRVKVDGDTGQVVVDSG